LEEASANALPEHYGYVMSPERTENTHKRA
jgi:hypothetical protein